MPAAPTPACLRKRRRLTKWWPVRWGVWNGILALLLWGAIEGKDRNSGSHDARGPREKSSGIFGREPAGPTLRRDFSQALFQMPPLGIIAHQPQGASVRLGGLRVAAEATQELGLCNGQQVIPVELAALVEVIHQREAALDPVRHRDRDRPVELDH